MHGIGVMDALVGLKTNGFSCHVIAVRLFTAFTTTMLFVMLVNPCPMLVCCAPVWRPCNESSQVLACAMP